MHTEDRQYNTIIDLLINLSIKIKDQDNIILKYLEEIERIQNNSKKQLEKIEQNLDYIKDLVKDKTEYTSKETNKELTEKLNNIRTLLIEVKEIASS